MSFHRHGGRPARWNLAAGRSSCQFGHEVERTVPDKRRAPAAGFWMESWHRKHGGRAVAKFSAGTLTTNRTQPKVSALPKRNGRPRPRRRDLSPAPGCKHKHRRTGRSACAAFYPAGNPHRSLSSESPRLKYKEDPDGISRYRLGPADDFRFPCAL